MSQTARKTAYYGVITALGLCLSYVETLIPINLGVPGAKLGLANLVVLLCLRAPHDSFRKNITGAALVGVLRIVLSGLLFGNLFAIAYSLAGFAAALLCEGLMEYVNEKRSTAAGEQFGLTCISAVGGAAHNMGQLMVAVALCGTPVLAYLPWLIIFGVAAGLVTGILGSILIKRVKQHAGTAARQGG